MTRERTAAQSRPVPRLCSEIQLFDLCDLERCSQREGRFCTCMELLTRFERIADRDESAPLRDAREDYPDDGEHGFDEVFDEEIVDDEDEREE